MAKKDRPAAKNTQHVLSAVQTAFEHLKYELNSKNTAWRRVIDFSNFTIKMYGGDKLQVSYHRIETGLPHHMTEHFRNGDKVLGDFVKELKKEITKRIKKVSLKEKRDLADTSIEKASRLEATTSILFGGKSESAVARYYLKNWRVYEIKSDGSESD